MYPDMNLAPGSLKDLCLDWTRTDLQGLKKPIGKKSKQMPLGCPRKLVNG